MAELFLLLLRYRFLQQRKLIYLLKKCCRMDTEKLLLKRKL